MKLDQFKPRWRFVEVGRIWLELPSPIHSYKPNTSSIRKPSSTRIIIPSKADLYIYIYIYVIGWLLQGVTILLVLGFLILLELGL